MYLALSPSIVACPLHKRVVLAAACLPRSLFALRLRDRFHADKRAVRSVLIASVVASAVLISACDSGASQDTAASGTAVESAEELRPESAAGKLVIVVDIVEPIAGDVVNASDVMSALQAELGAIFAAAGKISVVKADVSIIEAHEQAVAELRAKHSIDERYLEAHELGLQVQQDSQDRTGAFNPPDDLRRAIDAYENALSAFERELANSPNLAGLRGNEFGLVMSPAEGDVGRTVEGERWILLPVGLLGFIFPAPADLAASSADLIDFGSSLFDPYREGYDDARRAAYITQTIANRAAFEFGRLIGLEPNSNSLSDAMHGPVNVNAAEHFARGGQRTTMSESDTAEARDAIENLARRAGSE